MANNKFAVSVGDVIARDPNTGEGLFIGKTNVTTSIQLAMTATEIKGGKGNQILYKYMHDRMLTATITKATFSKAFIAFNLGTQVQNKMTKIVKTDCVKLDENGMGTLTKIPVGNKINVFVGEDSIISLTQNGQSITIPSLANEIVTAQYETMDTIDMIDIGVTAPPRVVDLTILIDIFDNTQTHVETVQYNIPNFQIDGNYELSLGADGVSQETITGTALASEAQDCEGGTSYGTVAWIPTSPLSDTYTAVVITNGDVVVPVGVASTINLNVVGIRGGIKSDVNLTTVATYEVATLPAPTMTGVTVDAFGVVSVPGTVADGEVVTIVATYGDFKDSIRILAVA